jgi:hypothetical protein
MTKWKRSAITVIEVGSVMYTRIAYSLETVEKEVQDTSCRGSGGVPQL